jgi:hypothetical protein
MTPSELLSHLLTHDPLRERAATALYALLQTLVRGRLIEPSSGQAFEVRELSDRDEVVARVALKVLQVSPLPVAGKSDAECRRYLSTMLVRAHIAEYRKRSRLVLPGDEKLYALKGSTVPDDGAAQSTEEWVTDAKAVLGRVFERVLAERQERFRPAVTQAYQQILELVFDQAEFQDVLRRDEGADALVNREEFVRARNRVFKNHERLRIALRETAERMEAAAELSSTDAERLRQAVVLLFRCQNSAASRVEDRTTPTSP